MILCFKNFAVSGGFNYFTNSKEANYYKKLIKKYDIDSLVYLGNSPDLMHLKNCVGEIYKQKKNVGFHATRNPYNKGVIITLIYLIMSQINLVIVNFYY